MTQPPTSSPDVPNLSEDKTRHMSFRQGIHHCPGSPLARQGTHIAFTALLDRLPGMRLAVPFAELGWGRSRTRSLEPLPVRLT